MLRKTHSLPLTGLILSASPAADGSGGSDLYEKPELTEFRANAEVKGVVVSRAQLWEAGNSGIRLSASLIHDQLQNKFSEGLGK